MSKLETLEAQQLTREQISKGLELRQIKQWDAAITQFQLALKNDTELARPDLELALIYHQQKKDYVRAIYHYQTYLDKRPDSEKKPFIKEWIQHAELSLAAEIGQHTSDSSEKVSEELIRLKRENNLLRKRLSDALAAANPLAPAPRTDVPVKEPTPTHLEPIERIQTPAPIPGTYKVLPGDTLSQISRTVYGTSSKWKEIYGANLDKMKNENDLQAGQTIIIPKLRNSNDVGPDPTDDSLRPRG